MIFPFIDQLSMDHLRALAQILASGILVLALGSALREWRASKVSGAGATSLRKSGRFGFPRSLGSRTKMRVLQISDLSPTVKNFRLLPLEGYMDYEPGQFLSFYLGENGKTARSYSLSSTPSAPGIYEVSVKLLEGGVGSTWMHTNINIGDVLDVSYPNGKFVLKQEAKQSIFVPGGIGITPMMSMAQYCVDSGDERPLFFFYAARTEEELVFHGELQTLARKAPNFHYHPILSRPSSDWTGAKGRISAEFMVQSGANFAEAELYTCGPSAMMESAKDIATSKGMPAERYYSEVFASPASVKRDRKQCKITYQGQSLQYDDTIPLLDFLENNDIPIASSCRAGVCGTCEITLEKGEVFSLPNEFLTEADKAEGRRLSCICFPESDLEIS